MRMFYPLVDVSIHFSPLLDFILNACSEVDIHFVLFEFVVVLLWEIMVFSWIIWGPHNGNPMGITLLKFFTEHLWENCLKFRWISKRITVKIYLRNSNFSNLQTIWGKLMWLCLSEEASSVLKTVVWVC